MRSARREKGDFMDIRSVEEGPGSGFGCGERAVHATAYGKEDEMSLNHP
jgi:hypothetical protein